MTADPVPKTIQSLIEPGNYEREREREAEEERRTPEEEVERSI